MAEIRVLVVDDSAFMRKVIGDMIQGEPGLALAGTARNGQDAINKVAQLKPDVVTMDVEMPVMDGLTAVERLMSLHPLPIVMLSSLTKRGCDVTIDALEKGAVDFIHKPSGTISLDIHKVKDELINKIKVAVKAKIRPRAVKSELRADSRSKRVLASPPSPSAPLPGSQVPTLSPVVPPFSGAGGRLKKLVAIGTSTGGPKALYEVIPRLPKNLDAGILIVQHMPPGFTRSLAERLDNASAIRVKEAENGEEVLPGVAYIAPGDHHLCVQAGKDRQLMIRLTQDPPVGGHRPAVDVMMKSVAQTYWSHMVGVILTGMGGDGSDGIRYMKQRKARVIAEDASTCVVFGMPKMAIETGCVDKVAPITQVADEIVRMLGET